MNTKIISKLLATMLVITLTFANVLLLGDYANKVFATENNLDNQTVATNNPNVEFDAYYMDKSNKAAHSIKQDINSENLQLYLYAKVTKGYLKDIKVNMFGEDETKDTNFIIKNNAKDLTTIESVDTNSNSLKLKQLDKDTQVVIKIPVYANKDNIYDIANFNKQNNIKITATYVDNNAKEVKITKTVKTSLEWNAKVKAVVEQEVLKNINITTTKGVMLQTVVRTELENSILPIQKTDINIKVPTIDGIKPEKVLVIANGTKATNGKDSIAFNKDNWNYNEKTGELNINTKNEAIENKVSWDKGAKDEYVITYIFPEAVTSKITPELNVNQEVTAKITAYGATTQDVSVKQELKIDMATLKGEVVSNTVQNSKEQLSKGYLYSKVNKTMEYVVKNIVQIPNVELIDKIVITNRPENLLEGDKQVSLNNYSLYTKTFINKTIFDTLLGEEGYIKVYKENGELITTINKETTIENGNYIYNYEGQINTIVLETSKPIAEGNLIIENIKAINYNTNYTTEQIAKFNTLQTTVEVKAMNKDKELSKVSAQATTKLMEPQTKIEAEINKNSLSTVVTNEGIQIKTILKTDDESCMLYQNPVVEIELPNYIENIEINNVNLGYTNTLKYDLAKLTVTTNKAGNKVIRVPLEGKDEDYNFDNISKGANLIIDANLTLAKLTPTTSSNINVNVHNNNGTSQVAGVQIPVTAVAPVGMVATTQISEYSARNARAMALNGQEQTLKLDVNADERTVNVHNDIINNYNNICKNISILGKIPYQVATLKTPITLNGIEANKVTVYYTNNENATKDLNVKENGWTTSTDNLSQVKEYLIVINNYEMQTGNNIAVDYNLLIPAKLSYNLESNSTYTVYYDNVREDQTIKDSTVAARTTLTTGQGPELEVAIKANVTAGAEVQEGTDIKYTVSVKNIGKTVVENVTLKGNIPNRTVYFEYVGDKNTEEGLEIKYDNKRTEYSQKIDVIQPGETKNIEYNVKVLELRHIMDDTGEIEHDKIDENKEIPLEKVELNAMGQAIVDGYEKVFTSNSIKNKVIQGYITATIDTAPIPAEYARNEGDIVGYSIEVVNANSDKKNDVIATCKLPDDLAFESLNNEKATYDENTHTVIWNIGTLEGLDIQSLAITTSVIELEEGVYEKPVTSKVVVKTADKEIQSNEVTFNVQKPSLTVKLSTETQTEVNTGEIITYNVVVENIAKGTATGVKITDILPAGLTFKDAQYTYNGENYKANIGGDRKVNISIPSIAGNEKVEVQLTAEADILAKDEERREVTNTVKVTAKEIEEITSNEVKHIILKKGTSTDPSTDGEIVEGTYKISGMAWLDSNRNGKREDEEEKLANIEVMLVNAENGQIVKDSKTGNNKVQNTNEQGLYNFTNVPKGKYIVVYSYDTEKYILTEYRKEGVMPSRNSDAISTTINKEDGTTKLAAATDAMEVSTSNIYNMDIGLIVKSKFNLALDKTITKITVQDSKETKTYEYKDSKLAKVDLNTKTINDTNIIIEYKIKVSNIGDVEGYAKRIVDYMPQDMKFSSELNRDWYTADNGNLYNSSLAQAVIKPGETKELTLILTKKMTENNVGIINNKAEIYEAYNNLGLIDGDSTPANKVDNENDMSSADAAISIKTGEIPTYIGITVVFIAIFAVGIYFIKKKVLRRI